MRALVVKILVASGALLLTGGVMPALATPNTGSVSGSVSYASAPLAGVTVLARSEAGVVVSPSGITDASGDYSLPNLTSGRYVVTFLLHGYAVPWPGYTAARVTAGTDTAIGETEMVQGASISGHVTSQGDLIQPGARVVAIDSDVLKAIADFTILEGSGAGLLIALLPAVLPAQISDLTTAAPGLAIADNNGDYTIDGLRPGNYLTMAEMDGLAPPQPSAATLANAGDTATANFRFPDGATLIGFVRAADSNPLANVQVTVDSAALASSNVLGSSSVTTTTNAAGSYRVTGLPKGNYAVSVHGDNLADIDSATATVAAPTDLVTTNFVLPGSGVVTGTVLDETNTPVAGASVLVLGDATSGSGQVTTDSNGVYKIQGLPNDNYDVWVEATGYISPADMFVDVTDAAPTATVNFAAARGATIRGTVRGPDNKPVYGATITGLPTDLSVGTYAYDTTLPDGTFELNGLDVGSYKVNVEAPGFAAPAVATVQVTSRADSLTNDLGLLDLTHASAPAQPRQFVQAARGVLTVAVAAPQNDGGNPVTRYNVVVQPGNHKCSTYDAISCKVNHLLDGVLYSSDVSATNEVGTGPYSVLQAWTPAVPVVTAVKSRPGKKGQAIVSFKAPKTPNTIVTYKLEYKVGSKWKLFAHKSSKATTLTIKGLAAKKKFSARITTVLKLGRALTSKPFTIKTG